jgi:hypothetical protein
VWHATVTAQHAYEPEFALPDRFDIKLSADEITFGPWPPTPIVSRDGDNVIAQPFGMLLTISGRDANGAGTWQISGKQLEAGGTVAR